MKLSERLYQCLKMGGSVRSVEGMPQRAEKLEVALEDCRRFASWVECLGRTDCEIYKHELKGNADLCLERIEKAIGH